MALLSQKPTAQLCITTKQQYHYPWGVWIWLSPCGRKYHLSQNPLAFVFLLKASIWSKANRVFALLSLAIKDRLQNLEQLDQAQMHCQIDILWNGCLISHKNLQCVINHNRKWENYSFFITLITFYFNTFMTISYITNVFLMRITEQI